MSVRKKVIRKIIKTGDENQADWDAVKAELQDLGVDVDSCCDIRDGRIKVVLVSPDLKDSVEELGKSQRDQVVMVRVDEETSRSLDAWVESGAVKSRSEAAALFIREGLNVRGSELDQLRDALAEVDRAKTRLRARAREVFGTPPAADAE